MPDRARMLALLRIAAGAIAFWGTFHLYTLSAGKLLGSSGTLGEYAALCGSRAFFWAAFSMVMIFTIERAPRGDEHPVRRAGALLLLVLVVAVGEAVIETILVRHPYAKHAMPVRTWVRQLTLNPNLLTAVFAAVAANLAIGHRQAAERERLRLDLEGELARATAERIRDRLSRSDVYDTLELAAATVERAPREGRRLVSSLSDMLRMAVHLDAQPHVRLQDELDFADRYAALRRAPVSLHIDADGEALDALIRPGSVQAFVAPLLTCDARSVDLRAVVGDELHLYAVATRADGSSASYEQHVPLPEPPVPDDDK
jgi:hypothetical protein